MDKLFQRFQSTLTAEIKALEKTKLFIRKHSVVFTVEKLHESHRLGGTIITTAIGKCIPIAEKMAATLSSYGFKSFFLHPTEALHGDMGKLKEHDFFIIFSKSGHTQELLNLQPVLNCYKRVLITNNSNSYLINDGAILQIHVEDEGDGLNLAPMASTTAMLAVADGLCSALIEATGKTKGDFAKNHPGGSLGKQLLCTVNDLMETDPEYLPILETDTSETRINFFDLLMAFSTSRYGAVFIVEDEKLWGIFTDGDLRREIKKHPTNLIPIDKKEFTHPPRTTTKDTLAIDALKLMEQESRVTVLPVVNDQNHLVGVIHIHDLIKAGIF